MQRKYPHLSSPITIGRTVFRNRMFSAPMGGTDISNDGCIGPKSTAFYELRARGGAAAVTVSELMVHPATDGSHAYHLDESILNSLASATYTADAIRRHGAIPSLELSHSGMFAGTYMTDKTKQKNMHQWGPSATVRADGTGHVYDICLASGNDLFHLSRVIQTADRCDGLAHMLFDFCSTADTDGSLTSSSHPCSTTARTSTAAHWKTAAALLWKFSKLSDRRWVLSSLLSSG